MILQTKSIALEKEACKDKLGLITLKNRQASVSLYRFVFLRRVNNRDSGIMAVAPPLEIIMTTVLI
jgi:hypothetical protein